MSALTLADRLLEERRFHDAQAARRWRDLGTAAERLLVDEAAYLAHEPWVAPAFSLLGEVDGKEILDLGCGHGIASTILARRGAAVTAVDLSGGYLHEARRRAEANQVASLVRTVQAAGESLPFASASFDAIWGHAILHHLELEPACRELRRVLRPGGRAVFCEPWGANPLLEWARRWLPYPGKERSRDEEPLRPAGLAVVGRHFAKVRAQPYQLLGMVRRAFPRLYGLRAIDALDRRLVRWVPALGRCCRYIVVELQ